MKLRRLIIIVALSLYATPIIVLGQAGPQPANQILDQPSESARPHITFEEYVTQVLRSNLALAIEKSNVDLSKAAVTTAKVTPDWSVDVGSPTFDISDQGQPTNFSTALNVPIELGGKRGKRVHAALADVSYCWVRLRRYGAAASGDGRERVHCFVELRAIFSNRVTKASGNLIGLWKSMNNAFGSATSETSNSCSPGSTATSSRSV